MVEVSDFSMTFGMASRWESMTVDARCTLRTMLSLILDKPKLINNYSYYICSDGKKDFLIQEIFVQECYFIVAVTDGFKPILVEATIFDGDAMFQNDWSVPVTKLADVVSPQGKI